MSVHRNRTPRMAALFLGVALGAASLTTVSAAQAAPAPHARVSTAAVAAPAKATAPTTVVTRLSASKGVAGDKVLIKGTKLATADGSDWDAKEVKFGETALTAANVTALSESTLVVTVPAGSNGVVTVLVGDATKGPKFTYAAPAKVTTTQDDLDDLAPVSETGLADVAIAGTNFTKATKVLVGGKATKLNKEGGFTATKLTVAFPAGLIGVQDVVVVDGASTYYVGYVTYAGKPVTVTAVSGTSYVEQNSTVELTGTNLDLVATVTYDGAKAAFKKPAKGTTDKLTVTIPKGEAVTGGDLVVTTKYEASATIDVNRVAAPVPALSEISTVTPATTAEVTLTGTGLTGLKKVVVKSETGKLYSGSKISVTSATSAKVTLPALPAGDYTIQVFAISATGSTAFDFTVGTPAATPTVTGATSSDGLTVVITGTNLTGANSVTFTPGTGTARTVTTGITVNSATQVTVVLSPALAAETYDVAVTTPGGTSGTSGADALTIS